MLASSLWHPLFSSACRGLVGRCRCSPSSSPRPCLGPQRVTPTTASRHTRSSSSSPASPSHCTHVFSVPLPLIMLNYLSPEPTGSGVSMRPSLRGPGRSASCLTGAPGGAEGVAFFTVVSIASIYFISRTGRSFLIALSIFGFCSPLCHRAEGDLERRHLLVQGTQQEVSHRAFCQQEPLCRVHRMVIP